MQHGRSTTMKPDGTKGDARRYLIVLQKQRGQWFVVGRDTIPIDYKAQPEPPEILAIQARAKASPTSKIILGKDRRSRRSKRKFSGSRRSRIRPQEPGDSDNVTRDRLFADDIMWMSSTGHVQTKDEFMTGVQANFAKNPKRVVNKHDDFTVRQLRRHDHSGGAQHHDQRRWVRRTSGARYMNVFMNKGGQWWFVAHGATPIVFGVFRNVITASVTGAVERQLRPHSRLGRLLKHPA